MSSAKCLPGSSSGADKPAELAEEAGDVVDAEVAREGDVAMAEWLPAGLGERGDVDGGAASGSLRAPGALYMRQCPLAASGTTSCGPPPAAMLLPTALGLG